MLPTSRDLETPRKAAFLVVAQHFWFWFQLESRRADIKANEKEKLNLYVWISENAQPLWIHEQSNAELELNVLLSTHLRFEETGSAWQKSKH